MRRISLVLFLFVLFPWTASSQGEERILSYDALISVKPTGDMEVTETIKVVSEGDRIKHGIFRDFPTRYKDEYGNAVRVVFGVRGVSKDGRAEPWWTEEMDNGVRVYIGSNDVVLNPGEYTYVLTYRTDRQLGFFKNHDELYWNVTGNGWEFAIDKAGATVELPAGAEVLSSTAYTGPMGDQGKDFTLGWDQEGRTVFSTTRPLNPREGLTIVVTWPKGFALEPTRTEKTKAFLWDNGSASAGAAGIVILLVYYFLIWLKTGKDPEKGVIIPQFEAPQGFSPEAVRYVMRMGFDHKTFAAAIVNMAAKGAITIEEDGNGEYTFKKKGHDYSALSRGEMRIAQQLFSSRTSLAIKTENHATIEQAIKDLRKSLAVEYEKIYFVTNKNTLIPGLVISVLGLAAIVLLGRSKPMAAFMTLWLSGWTAGCAMLVYQSFKAWRAAILERATKVFNFGAAFFLSLFTLPFLAAEGLGLWAFSQATSPAAVLCMFIIVLLNIVFYHLMKAPTIKGRKIMDQIEGLKLYLSVAESDRLNQLNPPEKTPEVFEKFLPYAMALDVEQAWCDQFADVLARARTGKEYVPGWYAGSHFGSRGVSGLASSLGAMSSSISSSSSPPGSRSGSGGGGSSGGGGGGGGGGGW